jgi:hypothetical protein
MPKLSMKIAEAPTTTVHAKDASQAVQNERGRTKSMLGFSLFPARVPKIQPPTLTPPENRHNLHPTINKTFSSLLTSVSAIQNSNAKKKEKPNSKLSSFLLASLVLSTRLHSNAIIPRQRHLRARTIRASLNLNITKLQRNLKRTRRLATAQSW